MSCWNYDSIVLSYVRFTPNSQSTSDWLTTKITKLVVTRELVGKVVCSSYVAHQKVISYFWILAIIRAHSPLKSKTSTTAFSHHKQSWNLSISLASEPTRSWILLWSQVFASRSLFSRWPRMSCSTIANLSHVTLEMFISCKVLLSQTGNSRRSCLHGRYSISFENHNLHRTQCNRKPL